MSLGRPVVGALLATALATTMCAGTYWAASAMQSDLADHARTTLEARHLTAVVVFSGRDARVWANTATARADAVAVLRTIPGVRTVVVADGAPPTTPRPSVSIAATSVASAAGTGDARPSTSSAAMSAPASGATAS